MVFREEYTPRIGDYDRGGVFSDEAALQLLETVGCSHADAAGDNVIAGSREGKTWIVTEWRVAFERRPGSNEKLRASTWLRGKAPTAMVRRQFLVTDASGAAVIRAEAVVVLMDPARGRLARITEDALAPYGTEEEAVFTEDLPRLAAPETFDSETRVRLRRSDIDFNGHVHNTRYVDIAREALPDGKMEPSRSIRVRYVRPLREGDEAIARCAGKEGGYTVCVTAGGETRAIVRWE